MTMRGILVHVDEHRALQSVLNCALLAARRFNGQMDWPACPAGGAAHHSRRAGGRVHSGERDRRGPGARGSRPRPAAARALRDVHARARRGGGRQRAARRRSRGRMARRWARRLRGARRPRPRLRPDRGRPAAARRGGALDERARGGAVRKRPADSDRPARAAAASSAKSCSWPGTAARRPRARSRSPCRSSARPRRWWC